MVKSKELCVGVNSAASLSLSLSPMATGERIRAVVALS